MQQSKLLKFFFPDEFEYITKLESLVKEANDEIFMLINESEKEINELKKQHQIIDFVNVDEQCLPPHPYKLLKPDDMKAYVLSVDHIYSNPKFKELTDYKINHMGNVAIQGDNELMRHNAGIAMLAIKQFYELFKDAHEEAEELKHENPGIDPDEALEIL
jgi:hypothetical protein